MEGCLSGKVCLVAGAGSGIGKEIGLTFAANGADVVITSIGKKPTDLMRQFEKMGCKAIYEQADVTDYTQMRAAVEDAIKQMGKIDVLVASGGNKSQQHPIPVSTVDFFRDIDPSLYVDYAQTRWLNRAVCARAVLDHMIEQGGGNMIFIASDAGRVATPSESMVGSAFAAVIMLAKTLALEFKRWKIRVNCICPTAVQGTQAFEMTRSTNAGRKVFAGVEEKMAFGVPDASDIAEAALFFASDASRCVTGQILSVNSGLSFP